MRMESIGVFDSGIGGLTVLRHLIEAFPREQFIYFGDTARVPYGNKSRDTILRYAVESTMLLMQRQIKLLVVACHTASAYALDELQRMFSIPIVGVIMPAVEAAVAVTETKHIAILGTRATIASEIYPKEISKRLPGAFIHPVACPLFVPLAEEPPANRTIIHMLIDEYLAPLRLFPLDVVILGCTHYPLIKGDIQAYLGTDISYIEAGTGCVEAVGKILNDSDLSYPKERIPTHEYLASDDPLRVAALGSQFLGLNIPTVEVSSVYAGVC